MIVLNVELEPLGATFGVLPPEFGVEEPPAPTVIGYVCAETVMPVGVFVGLAVFVLLGLVILSLVMLLLQYLFVII